MNLYRRFVDWYRQFMYGRNGVDALSFALVILSLVLSFFARIPLLGWLLGILQLFLVIIAVIRMFSRNISQRQRENAAFMALFYKCKQKFNQWSFQHKSGKDFRFFKCPGCHDTLRVPKNKGNIFVTCPRCGERFKKKT